MNNSELQVEWEIAVIFGQTPKVISIPKDADSFDFLGDHFEDIGLGFYNGFYDFLRGRTGAIIGIRYLPSDDANGVLKEVVETDGITRPSDGNMPVLQVLWDQNDIIEAEASCDQYFGNNFVYRSKLSRKLAVAFGVDVLTPQERAMLKQMTAR